jgi:hypothetical protein
MTTMPHCLDCADSNGICPGTGQPCDPNDVIVEMRNARPPYRTWRELGHGPFEIHGEQFAVTRNVGALDSPLKWRVSHVATGIAIPSTEAESKTAARDAGLGVLSAVGPEKFHAALTLARDMIATGFENEEGFKILWAEKLNACRSTLRGRKTKSGKGHCTDCPMCGVTDAQTVADLLSERDRLREELRNTQRELDATLVAARGITPQRDYVPGSSDDPAHGGW